MKKTASTKAIAAYRETMEAIDEAIAIQERRTNDKEAFYRRVGREHGPLLQSMRAFLLDKDPETTGLEIIRVAQSLRRFQDQTYTSFLSSPKWLRAKHYLNGVAAMVIIGGESLGRGLATGDA